MNMIYNVKAVLFYYAITIKPDTIDLDHETKVFPIGM